MTQSYFIRLFDGEAPTSTWDELPSALEVNGGNSVTAFFGPSVVDHNPNWKTEFEALLDADPNVKSYTRDL